MRKEEEKYTDFANVETQRLFLTSEEYPEGPYGSPTNELEMVENKETPWKEGQQFYSGFAYEFRNLHEGIPRQFPGAHPTHDNPKQDKEAPYDETPQEHS